MGVLAACPAVALASDVRVATFNIQGDTGISNSTLLPNVATVIEGIGQQQYVGDGILKLPDIIAMQETTSNTTSVTPVVNYLNTYYNHPGLYNSSSYQATQYGGTGTGNGPNALIYDQTTLKLLASVGVGTPQGGTNGEFRQVVRYEFQPVADAGTSNGIFYVYDSHYKSGSAGTSDDGSTDGALRNGEAQIIRNDEAANLPGTADVLYVGDFNGDGSTEAAYQTITKPASPSGVTQGAGVDPLNVANNYGLTWGSSANKAILTESDDDIRYRDDMQLMTANVYNGSAGNLSYIANSTHPFGNNGTTAYKGNVISGTNTAVNDIIGHGSLTPTTVLGAMDNTTGPDHLAVVADYSIAGYVNGIWTGGTGNWSNFTYWSNETIPTSTTAVQIDSGNTAASVVTVDQNATIVSVALNAGDTLNISSGKTLTLAGGGVNLINGTLALPGTLDLTTGALDITGSNLAAITALAKLGYNGGRWNGSGITSSTAANNPKHLTAIGVIQNNQSGSAIFTASNPFKGVIPGAGDILVRYTYVGDANLDGKVDSADYTRIDNGYLNKSTGWLNGDFNYDGIVNGSDYTLIDNAFNLQGAQLTAAIATDQITGTSSVPEPGSITAIAVAGLVLLRRRAGGVPAPDRLIHTPGKSPANFS